MDEKFVYEERKPEIESATFDNMMDIVEKYFHEYEKDYNSVVEIAEACCEAMAWACSKRLGLTGFQASCVGLRFLQRFNGFGENVGFKVLDYDAMLYPQNADRFEPCINRSMFEVMQNQAIANLNELENGSSTPVHPEVEAHWKRIADGIVPFGYYVKEEHVDVGKVEEDEEEPGTQPEDAGALRG